MLLTDEIKAYLYREGVPVVGFADLKPLPPGIRENFDFGIAIGLTYSKEAMKDNKNGNAEILHRVYAN